MTLFYKVTKYNQYMKTNILIKKKTIQISIFRRLRFNPFDPLKTFQELSTLALRIDVGQRICRSWSAEYSDTDLLCSGSVHSLAPSYRAHLTGPRGTCRSYRRSGQTAEETDKSCTKLKKRKYKIRSSFIFAFFALFVYGRI